MLSEKHGGYTLAEEGKAEMDEKQLLQQRSCIFGQLLRSTVILEENSVIAEKSPLKDEVVHKRIENLWYTMKGGCFGYLGGEIFDRGETLIALPSRR